MYKHRILISLAISLILSVASSLSNAKESVHRQHGPHVHGVAQLNIAVDGNKLELELTSPAINMVGFEHFPRSEKQRRAIKRAILTLQGASQLFVITPAARCKLTLADVSTPLIGKAHKLVHADFSARYTFQCQPATAISSINVNLFRKFPSIREIKMQLLTDKGQTAAQLTAQQTKINF